MGAAGYDLPPARPSSGQDGPQGERETTEVTTTQRDLVVLHVAFAVVAAVVLLPGGPVGWRSAVLLVVYDVALVVLARRRGDRELLRLWWFAAVLSLWQVLPDAFLVEGLDVLVFPDDGFPDLGPVTGVMAGLWTVPIVVVVAVATAAERRGGVRAGNLAAAAMAAVVFAGGEASLTAVGLWEARNVPQVAGVALYIVPAEVVLGVTAHRVFHAVRFRHGVAVIPATLLVSVVYTGAAGLGWLLLGR